MKKQDIVIDFTSLLDVTLIIIFFFIMFGNIDTDNKTKKAMEEAQVISDEAAAKLEEAEELKQQADEALRELAENDARQDENINALKNFDADISLKLYVKMEQSKWSLIDLSDGSTIYKGDGSDIGSPAAALSELLTVKGYTEGSTILCELYINAELPGTKSAYRSLDTAFSSLKKTYQHFYLSETDISIFKESEINE